MFMINSKIEYILADSAKDVLLFSIMEKKFKKKSELGTT